MDAYFTLLSFPIEMLLNIVSSPSLESPNDPHAWKCLHDESGEEWAEAPHEDKQNTLHCQRR